MSKKKKEYHIEGKEWSGKHGGGWIGLIRRIEDTWENTSKRFYSPYCLFALLVLWNYGVCGRGRKTQKYR
jgi:hypothetical protein